jgi:hypothetical protein
VCGNQVISALESCRVIKCSPWSRICRHLSLLRLTFQVKVCGALCVRGRWRRVFGCTGEIVVDPWLLPASYKYEAEVFGASIRTNCAVQRLAWNSDCKTWRIFTSSGVLSANLVVNAAGVSGGAVVVGYQSNLTRLKGLQAILVMRWSDSGVKAPASRCGQSSQTSLDMGSIWCWIPQQSQDSGRGSVW